MDFLQVRTYSGVLSIFYGYQKVDVMMVGGKYLDLSDSTPPLVQDLGLWGGVHKNHEEDISWVSL